MDTKERHVRENESNEAREARELRNTESPLETDRLRADGRNRKRESTKRINRLWLWLGVLILVAILLYWIFGIGLAEDLTGAANGLN